MRGCDMKYTYRNELLATNEEARRVIKPPAGYDERFTDHLNFEYDPSTHLMMFCWVFDKDAEALWIGREGRWFAFYEMTPQDIGEWAKESVDRVPLDDYEASKGCGLLTEQLALARHRFQMNTTELH